LATQQPYFEENAYKLHRYASFCGEDISTGKLGSAIVMMDAWNSGELPGLNTNVLMR